MSTLSMSVFRPRDGAILDLESLETLAEMPNTMLSAMLQVAWPKSNGIILEGLELAGTPSQSGPPGAVRPSAEINHAVISPGTALIRGRDGRLHLFSVDKPVHTPWPDQTGPRVNGVLVLYAEGLAEGQASGVRVARDIIQIQAGFVKPKLAKQPHILPVAAAVGNGRDWAMDLTRVFQPEHPVVQSMLKKFESLESAVWRAEPEGSVWERQTLGRSWVRYQTVAASSLQAARIQLSTRAMSTLERVRLLSTMRRVLEQSVERVATELLQMIGPPEGAGPYEAVVGSRR